MDQDKFEQMLDELDTKVEDLLDGKVTWREVTGVVKSAIEAAEQLVPESGSGETKKELVLAAWNHYDEEYAITAKLDELINFAKIIGKPIGTIVEVWDGTVLAGIVGKMPL
ncbi:hypothetical protein JW935_07060 [candidate division KSB1 bacterium]|nr:hypothetical protein [candidate division KSB1 bacterium]